jgi:dCMP deaminase
MRPSLDEFFMMHARLAAERATCPRKHVGAILVRDKRTIATGYNGSLPGAPHCDDAGCLVRVVDGNEGCHRTVHAEQNAIINAARFGHSTAGTTMYVTLLPCPACSRLIASSGVQEVIYSDDYKDQSGMEELKSAGVIVRQFAVPNVKFPWATQESDRGAMPRTEGLFSDLAGMVTEREAEQLAEFDRRFNIFRQHFEQKILTVGSEAEFIAWFETMKEILRSQLTQDGLPRPIILLNTIGSRFTAALLPEYGHWSEDIMRKYVNFVSGRVT